MPSASETKATPSAFSSSRCNWEIDHDYRGDDAEQELSYGDRAYRCSTCATTGRGYEVAEKSMLCNSTETRPGVDLHHIVTDAETAELIQPCERPFDAPTVLSQAAAVWRSAAMVEAAEAVR
jgi:hypothetical protein